MIGGLGIQELLIVLIIALFLFGGKKLPEIGQSLGKALRGFKEGSEKALDEAMGKSEPAETEGKEKIEDEEVTQAPPSEGMEEPEEKSAQESGARSQEEEESVSGS